MIKFLWGLFFALGVLLLVIALLDSETKGRIIAGVLSFVSLVTSSALAFVGGFLEGCNDAKRSIFVSKENLEIGKVYSLVGTMKYGSAPDYILREIPSETDQKENELPILRICSMESKPPDNFVVMFVGGQKIFASLDLPDQQVDVRA